MLDNGKSNGREKFIIAALFISFLVLGLIFVYLLVFINIRESKVEGIKKYDSINHVRDDILLKSSDGSEKLVNLPKKVDSKNTYSYNFVAKSNKPNEKLFMYIKSSYSVFSLYYKDELIYEKKAVDNGFIKSGGDFLKLVMIPDEYVGKELTITFKALRDSSYGLMIKDITLGSHNDLILYSYARNIDVLIISAFLLVFSFESFIMQISLYLYKKAHFRSLLVPLYALVVGLYIIVRSPIFYFLVPIGNFIYVTDYILFLLLPLTIAIFMISIIKREGSNKLVHKIIELVIAVFLLNLTIQIVLTYFGIIEFMDVQKFSQICVVSSALVTVAIPFTIQNFEFKRVLSVSMASLMVILVVLLGVYLSTYRIRYMTILGLVGGIFIIFQLVVVMKLYAKNYTKLYRLDLNKKLAFTDNLTRVFNRNAFENDMSTLKKDGQSIMLMIIDINNLKVINDEYGHNTGDFIIKSVSDILRKLTERFEKVKAYRIGGDEFVLTALGIDNDYAKNAVEYINYQTQEFRNRKYTIPFNFGMAYELTNINEDFNIDSFMQEVDRKMYEDKKLKKRNFSK